MTTTYLAYVRGSHEFDVAQEIEDMGLGCYCARKLEFVRSGKKRRPEPKESPYLPNYVFIELPAERFLDVQGIKYLANTMMALSEADRRSLDVFLRSAQQEYAAAHRVKDNQALLAEYRKGQALKLLDGRFEDRLLRFKEMVERAHDMFPKVRMEMEMMGQWVDVEADPIDVRAAE